MTCIARPLAFFLLVVTVAMITAGLVSVVISALAVTAVSVLGTIMAVRIIARTRRERAAAGACTTCRHPCQGRPVVLTDELSIRQPSWPAAVTFLGQVDLKSGQAAARWPDAPAASASQAGSARLVAGGRR